MKNYIIVDIETTSFVVSKGIREVSLLVIEDNKIVDQLHLGKVNDESKIHLGMGRGYEVCSDNEEFIAEFKAMVNKYKYPLVAHNASFDRKFLVYYNWIDEDYPFFDSIRAFKSCNLRLYSYKLDVLRDYLGIEEPQTHTALGDVHLLWEIIKRLNPTSWSPLGPIRSITKKNKDNSKFQLSALNNDYEVIENVFNDKTIVFTGKSDYSRNSLIRFAKEYGAKVSNDLSETTDILVVGNSPSSKLKTAEENGIEIMTMDEFLIAIGKKVV